MNRKAMAEWLRSYIEENEDEIAWRDSIVLEAIRLELEPDDEDHTDGNRDA